ncbi:MAG TPA: hypothetical protein VFZ84_17945 [Burkholderiales bacterium]
MSFSAPGACSTCARVRLTRIASPPEPSGSTDAGEISTARPGSQPPVSTTK